MGECVVFKGFEGERAPCEEMAVYDDAYVWMLHAFLCVNWWTVDDRGMRRKKTISDRDLLVFFVFLTLQILFLFFSLPKRSKTMSGTCRGQYLYLSDLFSAWPAWTCSQAIYFSFMSSKTSNQYRRPMGGCLPERVRYIYS